MAGVVDPHLLDGFGSVLTLLEDIGSKSQLVEDDNPNAAPAATASDYVPAVVAVYPVVVVVQAVEIQQGPPPGTPPVVVTPPEPALQITVLAPPRTDLRPTLMRSGRPLAFGPSIVVRSAPPLSNGSSPLPSLQPVRITVGGPAVSAPVVATDAPRRTVVVEAAVQNRASVTIVVGRPATFAPSPPRTVVVEPVRVVVQAVRSSAGITVGTLVVLAGSRGRVFTTVGRPGRVVVRQVRAGSGFTSRPLPGRLDTFGGT